MLNTIVILWILRHIPDAPLYVYVFATLSMFWQVGKAVVYFAVELNKAEAISDMEDKR